jgi:Caenorhabditis protein of unknown function, DUF268
MFKIYLYLLKFAKHYFKFPLVSYLQNCAWYLRDFRWYQKNAAQSKFALSTNKVIPCLYDKTTTTPIEPIYFYQDSWAAEKIFSNAPAHHYDIASSVKTMGIISGKIPVTLVDIRPPDVSLPNLHFQKGDITQLPFESNSINSISSLCVIEHIGLGRYGDALDTSGSEKAVQELQRVTAPGGFIYFSVPIDDANKIYFNAHRAFTPEYVRALFAECNLIEERYLYGYDFGYTYDKTRGFGTGVYLFQKR